MATSLTGTASVDNLNNSVQAAFISALGGDDSITNSGDYVTIDGGAGNDFITNTGKYASVVGDNGSYYNNGNDTIVNSGTNSTLSGGNGNDSITNTADKVTIDGGSGTDTIKNSGANVSIGGGSGDLINNTGDSVTIGGSGNSVVSSGKNVSISAGTSKVTVSGANTTINAYRGGHNISLESGATGAVIVYDSAFSYTGTGYNDNVIYGFGETSSIQIGDGKDTFTKQTSGADVVIQTFGKSVTLKGAADLSKVNIAGKNVVPLTVNNTVNNTLVSGDLLNDSITNSGDSVTIKALDGNDTITNSGTKVSIDAGAGNDKITNSASNVTINAGAGHDTILSSGSNATIDAGAGSDIISLTGGGSNVILSSAGGNVVYGFKATDTIKVGDGTAKYWTLSSGNDVIVYFGGGGYVTLKDVKALATLNIAGTESFYVLNTVNATLIQGTDGDDTVDNGNYNYTHSGGDSVTIDTGAGDDSVNNWSNHVSISGGAGKDDLWNIGSNVTIDGGDGDDSIRNYYGFDGSYATNVSINGGAGNDSIENYGNSNVTIDGGAGSDFIENYDGSNVSISGGEGDDSIRNESTNVSIDGGAGNDKISVSGSNVTVDGGADNDNIYNAYGTDLSINGGDGSDTITNGDTSYNYSNNYGKNVTIDGGAGNDSIQNYASDVTISGGDGSDTVNNSYGNSYGNSNVSIDTGAGKDSIWNSGESVTAHGGEDDDIIWNDRNGYSKIYGDGGNDSIVNSGNYSTLDGGDGNDTIDNGYDYYGSYGYGDNVSVDGGAGNDLIRNRGSYATIKGGDGADTIDNANFDNNGYYYSSSYGTNVTISGGAGNDSIRNGATSNVTIDTGEGNDTIKVGNTSVTSFFVDNLGAGDVIELYRAVSSISAGDGKITAGSLTISYLAGEQGVWEVNGTSATFYRSSNGITAKLGSDGKTITFEASSGGTNEELFDLSGLKAGVTAEELSANVIVNGTTVTVNENILGEDDLSIGEGYTLALADSVPKSEDVSANWQVSGATATYTGDGRTAGYVLDNNAITYRDAVDGETFTLTGVKKNLTKSVLRNNVTIDGATVTLNENVLGDSDVSISGDYILALADTVPQSEGKPANWNISATDDTATAIYSAGSATAGYSLDDNKILYSGATCGTFTLTGLSKDFTSDDVTIEGTKIILSADALAKTAVALTTNDGFTLALDEDVPTVGTVEKGWTLSGTTATYRDAGKSDGYKLSTSKTVTYTAAVGGKALLTVKGLADGLTVVDGAIDGLSIDGKVLTVTPEVVGENLSVGAGYKVVFDEGNYGGSKFTGTTGRDTLEVNGSALEIEGNKGNDTITSNGDGGNTYLFAANGGKDVVVGYGDDDTVKITDDSQTTVTVKNSDIIVKAGNATMTLKDAATGKHLTVVDANDDALVDKIFYADRTVDDDGATLTAAFNSTSFAADDTIKAVDGSAVARKFSLTGGDEDNTLIGGKGANFINGGGGENELTGGNGNDTFAVGNGVDIITDYGNGTDKISLTADVTGFEVEGDNVIISFGDEKSVTIQDGAGKKIYFLQNGRSTTEIFETGGKLSSNGKSITLASTTTDYEASDAIVTIDGSLTTDGVKIIGNGKNNKIFGGEGSDILNGSAGKDTLTGGDGSDIFVFESGKDVITDYTIDDKISLTAAATSETLNSKGDVVLKFGTDSLTIKKVDDTDGRTIVFAGDEDTTKTYFSERIVGDDGVTLQSNFSATTFAATKDLPKVDAAATKVLLTLAGGDENNVLIGGTKANVLDGGAGDDVLIGNGGNDTFVYSAGDDTIGDYESRDKISLSAAIQSYDLDGDDVIIGFGDGSLTIADAVNSSVTFVETGGATQLNVFAAEGIFNGKQSAVTLNAATESYTAPTNIVSIDGGLVTGEIEIVGNAKANHIHAGNFGSTLNGGAKNDSLWGGNGSDTFIYESGGGQDVIYGFGDGDALQLEGKFTASFNGDDILFKVGSLANAVTLKDYSATTFNVNGDEYTITNGKFTNK